MIYDDRLIANRQPFPVVQLVQQGRARRKRTGKKEKSKKRVKNGARARQHIFFKKGSFPELGVVCKLPKWQTGSKAQKASSLAGDFVFRYLKMAQKVSVCRRNAYSWQGPEYLDVSFLFSLILSLGHTRKFIPPPWYKRVGGGVMEPGGIGGTPPWSFWCCSISKRLCLQWKAFDLLNKMRYILRVSWYCWGPVTSPTVLANLAAILDFTNN